MIIHVMMYLIVHTDIQNRYVDIVMDVGKDPIAHTDTHTQCAGKVICARKVSNAHIDTINTYVLHLSRCAHLILIDVDNIFRLLYIVFFLKN
jgi:hypothetical protein